MHSRLNKQRQQQQQQPSQWSSRQWQCDKWTIAGMSDFIKQSAASSGFLITQQQSSAGLEEVAVSRRGLFRKMPTAVQEANQAWTMLHCMQVVEGYSGKQTRHQQP